MQSRSQRIAELQTDIDRYVFELATVRAEQQRITDQIRLAKVMLAKLENDEERDPTFLQIPPNETN